MLQVYSGPSTKEVLLDRRKLGLLFLGRLSLKHGFSITFTASYSTEACSIITKELFASCFSYLSPLPYFEQCRRDTCKCGQICMCSALAHYVHQCHRFGVVIDFRSNVPECGKLFFRPHLI